MVFKIETVFGNGARLTWQLETRSMVEAQAKAWDSAQRLLDAAPEVVGHEVDSLAVFPVGEEAAA